MISGLRVEKDETMFGDLLERAVELRAKGEPFVLATVVAYKRPQSAKPGSKAIISQDGVVTGWVGGGCVQPIVIREAQKGSGTGQIKSDYYQSGQHSSRLGRCQRIFDDLPRRWFIGNLS